MTTKTVAVTLIALTQQYQKAMAASTASTAKLQTTSAATAKGIGSVMGPQIALGAAVAAGAAVKMALDFDNAFTRIAAVTNTSAAQVGQWKEQVLSLAGETAKAPQELAEALYFLASAGLDADQVMPALEASAKAAASGLGETADIARLTANAMNAYAASGLTAAQVTDVLVAAVRSGTAEPDEFADAMGRILPIASKAGISFDQVAASLAGVSNIGLDVNEGVTAMRGVMVALLAPGKQAADTLAEVGLSADAVRRSLAEDGLIATLRLLEQRTGGNIDLLRKIIPNVRAMAGAFGLTGQEAAKVDQIFADVQNSAGSLDKAFNTTAESAGHKLRQAFVDLQIAAINVGGVLIPLLTDAIDKLELLGGAAVLAADKLSFLKGPVERATEGWTLFDNALTDVIPGMGLFNQVLDAIPGKGDKVTMSQKEMAAAFDRGKLAGASLLEQLFGLGEGADEATPPVEGVGAASGEAAKQMEDAEKATKDFALALKGLTGIAFDVEEAQLNWHQGLIDLRKELRAGAKTLDINSQAGIDNREALKGQLENAMAVGIAMRQKGKSEESATNATIKHVQQVRAEAIAAGFAKGEVDKYIRTLNLTPKDIRTLIRLEKTQAQAALSAFIGNLDRIPNIKDVLIRVRSTGMGTGQQIGHSGGVVGKLPRYHGGGDVKSDEQLVLARKGEHILTDAQYRARPVAVGSTPQREDPRAVRVGVRLDRRRFTEELDHDATYAGRWSG